MAKSYLARRLQTRQTELDVVLQELESAGKVKLTEIKGKLVVGLGVADELPTISASSPRSSSSPQSALYNFFNTRYRNVTEFFKDLNWGVKTLKDDRILTMNRMIVGLSGSWA